jgi:hypothetical protein
MTTDVRPQLPGTLEGLLDAGTRLYHDRATSDDLLKEMLAALDRVERAVQRGEDISRLLFEIGATVRLGTAGRQQIASTLRVFAPHDAVVASGQQPPLPHL